MITVRAASEKVAEILIYDVIGKDFWGDGVTAARVKQDLDALGDVSDINVRINSPGGNVFDGIAIFNLLKQHKAQVHVQIDGFALSAASLIAMAGDLITMGEGAMMMIHNPWTLAIGDANAMRKTADVLEKITGQFVDIYAARSDTKAEEIRTFMDSETWFTAAEAVEHGFADEQTAATETEESEETEAAARSEAWQRCCAAFKKTPKALIESLAAGKLPIAATSVHKPSVTPTSEDPMTTSQSVTPADVQKAAADATVKALADESARKGGIKTAFGRFKAQFRDLYDSCIEDVKCSVEAAREKLLAKLGEGAQPIGDGAIVAGKDASEKFLAGAEQALLMRAGLAKKESGNEFYGRSFCDLAEHTLAMQGVSVRGLTKDGIARKILASHTTSDFPLLLANTAGKVLRAAYQVAPVTWNRWCKVGSVSDFKQASRHTVGSFSSLLTKPERGEYKQGTIGEEREPITAITKGRYISLSREMIVNDDLGGFADMSRKMGRSAARTVEADVYTLLTSASGAGPTMSDTGAFFNATAITTAGGHANLTSSGTAISVASIAVGEAAMMAQKDKSLADFVFIQPRVLLCSPAKKQIAWETVNSLTDVASSNANKKNYVQAQMNLEVVASPYLSGNPWYLFSDPSDVEAFEVAFLDGVQEPFIDEEVEFMTDAMNMKVRLDYGVAAIDWRGGYRNAGA